MKPCPTCGALPCDQVNKPEDAQHAKLRNLVHEVVGDDRDWTDAAYAAELPSRLAEFGWFKRARAALT